MFRMYILKENMNALVINSPSQIAIKWQRQDLDSGCYLAGLPLDQLLGLIWRVGSQDCLRQLILLVHALG